VSGIFYLMFATFPGNIILQYYETIIDILHPALFSEVYHFSTGVGGLAYIGIGIGFFSATIFGVKFSDKIYIYVCSRPPATLTVSAKPLS
jgi:hypothetical protein